MRLGFSSPFGTIWNRMGIDRRKMTVWVPKVTFYGGTRIRLVSGIPVQRGLQLKPCSTMDECRKIVRVSIRHSLQDSKDEPIAGVQDFSEERFQFGSGCRQG
jgi:hypothetical protein